MPSNILIFPTSLESFPFAVGKYTLDEPPRDIMNFGIICGVHAGRASRGADRRKKKGGVAVSIMIDLPPAMAQEAQGYAELRGTTLEQILFDYLKSELARKAEVDRALAKLDGLVRQSHGRLSKPYKFNRADAYEPEVPCA